MGLKSFFESCIRLIKLIGKPEKKELWASIKISFIGLGVLEVMGFIIKFLATMLLARSPST